MASNGGKKWKWLILIWISLCSVVFSQGYVSGNDDRAIFGYFMFGAQQTDFSQLNPLLKTGRFADFSETLPTLGGGGHAIFRRFLIGVQGHYLIAEKRTGDNGFQNELSGGLITLDLGVNLSGSSTWLIYPLLSTGGGWLTLKIQEQGTLSFDDLLSDPGRSVEIRKSGFLVSGALGIDYVFHPGQTYSSGSGGFVIGLRAGYQLMSGDRDWENETLTISNGPNASLDGYFVRILLGAGGN